MGINQIQIDRIIALAKTYGATRLILFGSAAEAPREVRDIDLACDGIPGWGLYKFAARLEEELGVSLDIVALSPPNRFTRHIEKKARCCYKLLPVLFDESLALAMAPYRKFRHSDNEIRHPMVKELSDLKDNYTGLWRHEYA